LLVLGHVTRDVFGAGRRLGGAASFAAQAAVLLGIDTALVTVAPPHAPELDLLRELPGLQLVVAPSEQITTFGLEYAGGRRRLSLLERARPLTWQDIPAEWRAPELLYVGPVAGECDEQLVGSFGDVFGIGCIQGWLRDPVPGRLVGPRALPGVCQPPPALKALSFSASDHPGSARIAQELAARGVAVAVTRGRRGARVSWGAERCRVPAAPAREVDPTGAGDVFAFVFGWSRWSGFDPPEAARRGALAAARVVEGPGLGTLAQARLELLQP
jgi:sugar/nucleoside kinase (ribokinase family)